MSAPLIDYLAVAVDRLAETVADQAAIAARTRRMLVRKLKPEIARVFSEQGRAVLAAFAKRRTALFTEAAAPKPKASYDWILTALDIADMGRSIAEGSKKALIAGAMALAKAYGVDPFKLSNPRAAEYLKEALNRSKQIDATTFDSIRTMLTSGISEGRSYSTLAREIRERFEGFSRERAQLIAVTEIGDAYSQGTLLQAEEMQRGGMEMEKSWLTVGDDRVSDGCAVNQDAGWIDLDEDFPSGDDAPLRFPGCRCSLLTRRKGAED